MRHWRGWTVMSGIGRVRSSNGSVPQTSPSESTSSHCWPLTCSPFVTPMRESPTIRSAIAVWLRYSPSTTTATTPTWSSCWTTPQHGTSWSFSWHAPTPIDDSTELHRLYNERDLTVRAIAEDHAEVSQTRVYQTLREHGIVEADDRDTPRHCKNGERGTDPPTVNWEQAV